ncbi:MAG: DUF1801 domain-containing protein [Actinobacteria bacterium]|nr:DUF1801 domain-containing protein [Actinomycetota bacterium]
MSGPSQLIDDLIAGTPDWRGATLAKLRRIIHDADPGVTEEVKWRRPSNPMGAPVFEHNGIVCILGVLKERVRLSFAEGASLPDPQQLFNAMLEGNKVRAIDIYEGDKLNETALKDLIRSGVAHNLAKVKPARARKK